jgi:predicted acylesterase/phospholipase RssA
MTIKNIVLSGGGYNGLYMLGTINELLKKKFLFFKDIEKIYGTSFGALCGFIMCLNIEWKDVIEYFIERPWNNMMNITLDSLIAMLSKKGLLDENIINKLLEKLIISCGLETNLTFKELYDYSNIDFHTFHVEVNDFKLIDCSYKTHPEMKILDAIYSSCSLPFLFKPGKIEDKLCTDGGLLCSFPLNKCIKSGAVEDEILAIEIIHSHNQKPIEEKSTVFDYGIFLFLKLMRTVNEKQKRVKNYIALPCDMLNFKTLMDLLETKEMRRKYIEDGEKFGITFLEGSINKLL